MHGEDDLCEREDGLKAPLRSGLVLTSDSNLKLSKFNRI